MTDTATPSIGGASWWDNAPPWVRASHRSSQNPSTYFDDVGFRCFLPLRRIS